MEVWLNVAHNGYTPVCCIEIAAKGRQNRTTATADTQSQSHTVRLCVDCSYYHTAAVSSHTFCGIAATTHKPICCSLSGSISVFYSSLSILAYTVTPVTAMQALSALLLLCVLAASSTNTSASPTVNSLLSSPTCTLNGTACPPPRWPAQWNLTLSTVCQPSSDDYFLPPADQPWGLISLDWSVAMKVWMKPNQSESTCEETSIEGCRRIKAISPDTRCFIYHNMELALQAFTTQRRVMYDASRANWFIQYTDGRGNKNGTIYNEPGGPGDQYFWDYRLPEVKTYYVKSVMSTLAYDEVDGTFSDDVTGWPEEHDGGPANVNMSDADVQDIKYHTGLGSAMLVDAVVAAGKYNWQAFGAQDGVGPGIDQASCTSFLTDRCTADFQQQAITMQFDDSNAVQSIAGFLIVRGPTAFLGYGWESDQRQWNELFLLQVGEPQGLCVSPSSGVFVREWTYGNVTLDCGNWTAVVPHATGVERTAIRKAEGVVQSE